MGMSINLGPCGALLAGVLRDSSGHVATDRSKG